MKRYKQIHQVITDEEGYIERIIKAPYIEEGAKVIGKKLYDELVQQLILNKKIMLKQNRKEYEIEKQNQGKKISLLNLVQAFINRHFDRYNILLYSYEEISDSISESKKEKLQTLAQELVNSASEIDYKEKTKLNQYNIYFIVYVLKILTREIVNGKISSENRVRNILSELESYLPEVLK